MEKNRSELKAGIVRRTYINGIGLRLQPLTVILGDVIDSCFNKLEDTSGPGGATWETLSGKPSEFPPSTHLHNEYAATADLSNKVEKVTGKGLSENDYTTADQSKLSGIASGATVGAIWAGNIANMPSTFPPATHSHAESDVTNLITDLASKQASLGFTPENAANKNVANGYMGIKYAALPNDTLALALATNLVIKLTVTAARTLTTTVPPAGTRCTVLILTASASSFVVTFGSGFKAVGTLATGTTTARVFVIDFISDGVNLYEAGRTAAMVA